MSRMLSRWLLGCCLAGGLFAGAACTAHGNDDGARPAQDSRTSVDPSGYAAAGGGSGVGRTLTKSEACRRVAELGLDFATRPPRATDAYADTLRQLAGRAGSRQLRRDLLRLAENERKFADASTEELMSRQYYERYMKLIESICPGQLNTGRATPRPAPRRQGRSR